MSEIILVGFDGSAACERALTFAAANVKSNGGKVIIAHVLDWSPYSFLTPSEIEERHARRKDEMQRAEKAILTPARDRLNADGIEAETVIKYGNVADTLATIAKESGASQVVVGRDGQSSLGTRIFGSVAGSLVQISPVPCTIVP